VRQRARYTALLVRQADFKELSSSFVYWMQDLEPTILRTNPRFSTV
jgi:hypothetical protein